ncbi:MAG: 1-acyl-sn-glycerol-3-phosphate acyltransferase [Thermoanaerobaculia bacterium]|nr:1-acyl-sn-glycerol-3-phosphate acyltransferase [Thermoanaerobaculia bacterium]
MSTTLAVPLWIFLLMVLATGWALLDRLLLPSVRWFLRERANRVLDEVGSRLRLEIRPFQLTRRRALIDRLVYDPEVVTEAQVFAEAEGMPRQVAMEQVERYAREIVPAFNAFFYFRFGYWVARHLARTLYRVRLGFADEAIHGDPGDASVVFVINHRSNMDYILVSYLASTSTALSYAVGEWARIWPLESLLKAMGAYFVRRRSRNALYRKVLQRYVQMATAAGVPQAMFPEGGLSRDGRLRPPKLGLLDYIVRGFDGERGRDVLFVPVALNYDRTLEDRTLLLDRELDAESLAGPESGRPRRSWVHASATLFSFVARQLGLVLRGRWYRFGYACVNFGEPVSLNAYLAQADAGPQQLPKEERFALVSSLAEELMARIGDLVPVTPVSLVATVLLRSESEGLSELAIKGEVWNLAEDLRASGAKVYLPRGDGEYAVHVGLRMLRLRRLVDEKAGIFRVRDEERLILEYYAHSIGHLVRRASGLDPRSSIESSVEGFGAGQGDTVTRG